MNRESYPTDVSDEIRAFLAPYLTLISQTAPQRDYPLRELFDALRWILFALPLISIRGIAKSLLRPHG